MTDRTLRAASDFDALRFDPGGLLPIVAQDAGSGRVLMVAWANREALERTLTSGEMHFWSRSRRAPWKKGETSGNVLRVRTLHADCDGDTVLALVDPTGPACHTGEVSCFGEGSEPAASAQGRRTVPSDVGASLGTSAAIDRLWAVIEERARTRPEGSYTAKLLGDENLRLKKLGEELAELVAALARGEKSRIPEEAADLVYHLLVALRGSGVSLAAALTALEVRRR